MSPFSDPLRNHLLRFHPSHLQTVRSHHLYNSARLVEHPYNIYCFRKCRYIHPLNNCTHFHQSIRMKLYTGLEKLQKGWPKI